MNPDQMLIQAAYQDAVKKLYCALMDSYVTAGGDTGLEQQAEQHFIAGIGLARRSRDRALALLA